MSVQLLWELHALFSEGVYKPFVTTVIVIEGIVSAEFSCEEVMEEKASIGMN